MIESAPVCLYFVIQNLGDKMFVALVVCARVVYLTDKNVAPSRRTRWSGDFKMIYLQRVVCYQHCDKCKLIP